MFQSLCHDRCDMIIGKRVVDGFAITAKFYQCGLLENPQLVRYGGLVHIKQLRDIADAHLRLEQHVQNLDPGGIPKHLE